MHRGGETRTVERGCVRRTGQRERVAAPVHARARVPCHRKEHAVRDSEQRCASTNVADASVTAIQLQPGRRQEPKH